MRAFLMIAVLIEQKMFANFDDLYPDFIRAFKYPKPKTHDSTSPYIIIFQILILPSEGGTYEDQPNSTFIRTNFSTFPH